MHFDLLCPCRAVLPLLHRFGKRRSTPPSRHCFLKRIFLQRQREITHEHMANNTVKKNAQQIDSGAGRRSGMKQHNDPDGDSVLGRRRVPASLSAGPVSTQMHSNDILASVFEIFRHK